VRDVRARANVARERKVAVGSKLVEDTYGSVIHSGGHLLGSAKETRARACAEAGDGRA